VKANHRLRIAYVVNSLNPGGTEQLVVQMCRSFSVEFDMRVVCLDEPGSWAGRLRSERIPVYCLWRQPGLDPAMALKLAKFCREHRIDIIHAHQYTPWFYAALSRLIHRTPKLLLEEHGRFFPEIKKNRRILVNRTVIKPLTHHFVAVSNDVRRRLVEYEGLDYSRIDVIYNGVHGAPSLPPDKRAELRKELGFSTEDFVVGTVGRFDPIKNLTLLVKSLALAGRKIMSIKGLLVGDGPQFNEIRAFIDNLELSQKVMLPGYRDDARSLIKCMDLFVLSSYSEGTSMALLETMAAGVPAVVTDVGGNPELIKHGETGWVVPSDAVEYMTEAILGAATNSAVLHNRAEAARRRFQESFTFQKMVSKYSYLYRAMTASR
jgi:L-malate glycosyltransferase